MNWLALDIGGANLKVADGKGFTAEHPYALWQDPAQLHHAIAQILSTSPPTRAIAITMTGELADCYPTRHEGVRQILHQVEQGIGDRMLIVYRIGGDFVNATEAVCDPYTVAASNWHALATWASRQLPPTHNGIVIDIGSTTTDVIPITKENVCSIGHTDTERLTSSELVYTGVRRTPIAALVSCLPYQGQLCGVARETFATTSDVYLTLNKIKENSDDCATADGRPATREAAHNRIARMLCLDGEQLTTDDCHKIATSVMESQIKLIDHAIAQVLNRQQNPPLTALVSGSGEFLARLILQRSAPEMRILSISEQSNLPDSQCAPAHAVAVLAQERSE